MSSEQGQGNNKQMIVVLFYFYIYLIVIISELSKNNMNFFRPRIFPPCDLTITKNLSLFLKHLQRPIL